LRILKGTMKFVYRLTMQSTSVAESSCITTCGVIN